MARSVEDDELPNVSKCVGWRVDNRETPVRGITRSAGASDEVHEITMSRTVLAVDGSEVKMSMLMMKLP